jgi:hypothetical protein
MLAHLRAFSSKASKSQSYALGPKPTARALQQYFSEQEPNERVEFHTDKLKRKAFGTGSHLSKPHRSTGSEQDAAIPPTQFGYTLIDRALHALRMGQFAGLFRDALLRDSCLVDIDRDALGAAGLPPGAILDFLREVHTPAFRQQVHKMIKQAHESKAAEAVPDAGNEACAYEGDRALPRRIVTMTESVWIAPLDVEAESIAEHSRASQVHPSTPDEAQIHAPEPPAMATEMPGKHTVKEANVDAKAGRQL